MGEREAVADTRRFWLAVTRRKMLCCRRAVGGAFSCRSESKKEIPAGASMPAFLRVRNLGARPPPEGLVRRPSLETRRMPWDDGRRKHNPHPLHTPPPFARLGTSFSARAHPRVRLFLQVETRAALRGLREEKKAWLEARQRRQRRGVEGRRLLEPGEPGGAPPAAALQSEDDRGKALSALEGIIVGGGLSDSAAAGVEAAPPTDSRRATRSESWRKGCRCRGGRGDEEEAEGLGGRVEDMSIHPGERAESAAAPAAAPEVVRQEEEGEL